MDTKQKMEVRLLTNTNGAYVVLVKGHAGTLLVLTPEEAVDIAQSLLDVAQAAKTAKELAE